MNVRTRIRMAWVGVVCLAPVAAACTKSEANADPNSLTISVSTQMSGAACRPVADYSIGKDHPLRLVNYRVTMTGPGESDVTRIPTGEVLYESGSVKKSRGISIHNHDAGCADLAVVWDQFVCENEDRQSMDCPPIVLTGGSDLKSVEVVASPAE